ncbi:sensor histidine kinase [Actinomadura gamaensis]|uniref:histidine kinase n=1 Tax=Actinomadura gamaensis TaxID=1763541 RepID=A0ABV9TW65_9ACTN
MIRKPRAADAEDLPFRMARGMLWTALVLLFVMRANFEAEAGGSGVAVALAAASYPPLIALLLPRWRSRRRVRYGLLGAVTALALLPFAVVGTDWGWLPWTVAAAVLCTLPQRIAWPVFVLVTAATFGGEALLGEPFDYCVRQAAACATDGLIVFSLYALAEMIHELHAARAEQARLALVRERLRLDGELRGDIDRELASITDRLHRALRAAPGNTTLKNTAPSTAPGAASGAAPDGASGGASGGGPGGEPGGAVGGAASGVPAGAAGSGSGGVLGDALAEVGAATEAARRTLAGVRATASRYRVAVEPAAAPAIGSPRLARAVLLAVIVLQAAKNLVYMASEPGGDVRWLVVAVPVVAGAMALLLVRRTAARWTAAWALLGPCVWALFAVSPSLAWLTYLWGFVMGGALVTFRPPRSWALAAGLLGMHVAFVYFSLPTMSLVTHIGNAVSDLILAWLFASLVRLADLVVVLERARHEVAGAVTAAERLRVARDLHDVLGFALSAVALRGELAARLLERDLDRAAAELTALVELVERSRAELGSITGGRIRLRLDRELDAAADVLTAARITVRTQGHAGPLAEDVDTALATVLRECVTNVLRHSEARTCTITVTRAGGTVRLHVANDGAGPARGEPGSGLAGLAERTGGRLTAGPGPGGRFEVTAEFATGPESATRTESATRSEFGTGPESATGTQPPPSEPAGLPRDADGVDAVAGV